MISELEDVLVLLKVLPDEYQKQAAKLLRGLVFQAEEEMTATPEQEEARYQAVREEMARRSGFASHAAFMADFRRRHPDLGL